MGCHLIRLDKCLYYFLHVFLKVRPPVCSNCRLFNPLHWNKCISGYLPVILTAGKMSLRLPAGCSILWNKFFSNNMPVFLPSGCCSNYLPSCNSILYGYMSVVQSTETSVSLATCQFFFTLELVSLWLPSSCSFRWNKCLSAYLPVFLSSGTSISWMV